MAIALTILAFVAVIVVIWQVPIWQADRVAGVDAKDRFDIVNEARKTITQIVGGLFFLGTLYFTWRSAETSREQLELARSAQMTQRFASATEHLDAKDLNVRLGAIFALERVAHDSSQDYWPTMEVLTAYVRERAPWRPARTLDAIASNILKDPLTTDEGFGRLYCLELERSADDNRPAVARVPAADIQAVLTVLGRRKAPAEQGAQRLDLTYVDLRGANLQGAQLDNILLTGSNLQGVDGRNSSLNHADLTRTIAVDSTFGGASLKDAKFDGAFAARSNFYQGKLDRAQFRGSCLRDVQFGEASLRNAVFKEAFLVGGLFFASTLDGGDFELADVRGAKFDGSSVKGTDFRRVMNLSSTQLGGATRDNLTRMP